MSTLEPPNHPATNPSIASKEAVLDAAQHLIHLYGYTGFSMRDLAQQSGLAKATLYHHFQDKRQIFLQVLERDLVTMRDKLTAAAATPGDLPMRLHAVIMAFFELANKRGMLFLSTLREAGKMERELCALMHNYRDEMHHPIVELLEEAAANGAIRPMDPELTTLSFLGLVQIFTHRHLMMADLELDEKAADFILDLLLNGLLPPPSTPPSNEES